MINVGCVLIRNVYQEKSFFFDSFLAVLEKLFQDQEHKIKMCEPSDYTKLIVAKI